MKSLGKFVNLQAHGVWDAISPKDPKTTVVEEKEDKLALAAIYQAIPEDILLTLADKERAKEAGEAIKVTCQGADNASRLQSYKHTSFWKGIVESYVVKKLLRAVPTKFLQIASTIEQFGNLDTMVLEETVRSLKAQEERLKRLTDTRGNKLLLTREQWIERETYESKLLLTREEWLKRSNRGRKPKCDKDVKEEAHMAQIPDEEPALLLAKLRENEKKVFLINEE
ncbi:hypothetical protein AgCh_015586 [Apium graveolens]